MLDTKYEFTCEECGNKGYIDKEFVDHDVSKADYILGLCPYCGKDTKKLK